MFCQNPMLLHWSQFTVPSFPEPTLSMHLCSLQGRAADPPSQSSGELAFSSSTSLYSHGFCCWSPCGRVSFPEPVFNSTRQPSLSAPSHRGAAVHPDGPVLGCFIPRDPLLCPVSHRKPGKDVHSPPSPACCTIPLNSTAIYHYTKPFAF